MGETAIAVFNKILPGAFKADFFRYNILYLYGGCYFDSGTIYLEHLRDTIRQEDTFISSPDGGQFINNNWICSVPKHPILDLAIRRVIKRVANSERGRDLLDITGPAVLARAFLEYFENKLPIQEGPYPNNVRLLRQELHPF